MPTTVSMMIAAIVDAPSSVMTCSRWASARSASADLRRGVERRAVRVRPEEVRDRAVGRLVRPAARVARERDRRRGAAVVAAVHREHLAAPGHGTGHAHRVLVRVGAAVREEHLVEVAGRHLGDAARELAAHVGRHRGLDRGEAAGLVLDRPHEVGVLVAEVEVHELAREVEVARCPRSPRTSKPSPAAMGSGSMSACALHEWNTWARSSARTAASATGSGSGCRVPDGR